MTGVAAGDVLNIRAQPSADSERIGSIPADGRRIENLGCQPGMPFDVRQRSTEAERNAANRPWCRVRYGGMEGWVTSRFLAED